MRDPKTHYLATRLCMGVDSQVSMAVRGGGAISLMPPCRGPAGRR